MKRPAGVASSGGSRKATVSTADLPDEIVQPLLRLGRVDRLTGGGTAADKAAFARAFAPSGQLTRPEEVGAVVLDLCRGSAPWQSGDALLVDAGPTVTPLWPRPTADEPLAPPAPPCLRDRV
jgi:hypothetical protein